MKANATDEIFVIRDLGRMGHAAALDEQRRTQAGVVAGTGPQTLLLVEHEPVITISRRKGARRHLLAGEVRLAALGIDVQTTDRGGDITYHGPGQVVGYPILHLSRFRLNLGRYMHLLEDVALSTAAAFGVEAHRVKGCPGAWVDGAPARKLCALGVRVQRNVTMYGMAFNVSPDLSHYETILPCGIADKGVTSLRQLLGKRAPSMEQVKLALVEAMHKSLQGCLSARCKAMSCYR